jgi:integrase
MTDAVHKLMSQCVYAKGPDAPVFTRSDGSQVKDFRKTWVNACCAAGLARLQCGSCGKVIGEGCECPKKRKRPLYRGLLFHDLRRTAARNLRRAGVAEGVIMKIGGWRTRSVFERYAIVAQSDIVDAMKKLQSLQNNHSFNHSEALQSPPATESEHAN